MSSLTHDIARLATGLDAQSIPADVRHWAKRAIADTLACALAGAGQDVVQQITSLLPASTGHSLILGTTNRMHVLDAAQINGTAAHALDFDDCNIVMDGHPSVSIVPALFALAEQLDSNGSDVLTAYIAGIEAEIRLAALSNPAHVERGWHPTATFGVIGCAIACAKLLGLNQMQMATAIGIAASSAAGLRANSGTMTKPLHVAQANRNGVQAALLAKNGFTANTNALEHKFGYLNAFNGSVLTDNATVLADWAQTYAVLSPGIAIKQYPCCAFIHCAIDAASELSPQLAQNAGSVVAIRVHLHQRRLRNIDRPAPKDGLDARFSTQYLTARALLTGSIILDDFERAALCDPATQKLSSLVELIPHQEPDLSFGRVELLLHDGRQVQAQASVAMGRDPANPMSEAQFRAKFDNCANRSLSTAATTALYDSLYQLEQAPSIRAITAAMETR